MSCDNNADDIEDITSSMDPIGEESREHRSQVFPNSKGMANKHSADLDDEDRTVSVPGTQKIFIKTYGCSHNVSDSEYMEGILSHYGYRITKEQDDADLWLVNSCTVKDPSQAAFMNLVKKAKEQKKHIVVAGCVSQGDRNVKGLEDVSVVGISQIDRVVEAVEQTLLGNSVKLLAKKDLPRLDLPKVRKNPLVEIIPLSTGCLGSCTYCKTKHARGKLGSYELEAITDRVKTVITEGVSEIWLSSEDTGAYGRDIETDIGKLLKAIVALLPEEGVMLRIGMTNPPFILEHLEVIAEMLRHPKVFAFLHIPVQCASNRVLDAMNREYTIEEFRIVTDYLIEHVPDMTIATDIICGFPNETEADFQLTLDMIEHYKFAITNISQFYPRPGTPAASMKRIHTNIVKDRSRRLTKLFEQFTPYTYFPGQRVKVWFNTEISEDGGHSVGHTKNYVKVIVPMEDNLPGKSRWVDIHSCSRFHITGVIVQEEFTPEVYNINCRYDIPIANCKSNELTIDTSRPEDNIKGKNIPICIIGNNNNKSLSEKFMEISNIHKIIAVTATVSIIGLLVLRFKKK